MFVASPQNSGAANSRVRKAQRAANEVAFSYYRQIELFPHLNRWQLKTKIKNAIVVQSEPFHDNPK